ncbi:MAG: hypothetical protein IT565_10955 [Rhodospirillales bacterium]|nr:hypothetical protein [Rhodospirillales bacterium]
MKASLVHIRGSKVLRLPKRIREQCGFEETVELHPCGNCLIVSPAARPARQGWAEAFAKANRLNKVVKSPKR